MMWRPLLLFIVLMSSSVFSRPLRLVQKGQTDCISVEAPQETLISFEYEVPDTPTDMTSQVEIRYHSLEDSLEIEEKHKGRHAKPSLKGQKISQETGIIHQQAVESGVYMFCFTPKKAPEYHRFTLRILSTEELPEQTNLAPLQEHLTAMEQEMATIQQSLVSVMQMADYAKDMDHKMHETFLQMNAKAFYWPLVQIMVLLATGFTQVRNITEFFKRRRII